MPYLIITGLKQEQHPLPVDSESNHQEFNECTANWLKKLTTTLPDTYRIALELTEIENLSQYEVAERLQITYSGARTRVQRARKMLREKLDELFFIKTDSYGNVIECENRIPCCCKSDC
jgi:RNA polymerase sigma-70 factor (ECF subfamily)